MTNPFKWINHHYFCFSKVHIQARWTIRSFKKLYIRKCKYIYYIKGLRQYKYIYYIKGIR